jgi:uncharacterized RDD family membrane protein YckC
LQTISVRTAQNVYIQYPVASLGDRILAYFIDALIVIAYIIFIIFFLSQLNTDSFQVIVFIVGMPILFYHLLFEIFMDGQSPGKRQMQIKVVRIDGTPATLGNFFLRWLLRVIDIQLFSGGVAILTIAIGGKGQRVGDMAAGTTVVKLVSQREVTASEIFTQVENNYVPTFEQAIQLSDADVELIQQALYVYKEKDNIDPVNAIAEKMKGVLGIDTDMPPIKFLYILVKDYTHLNNSRA